MRVLCLAAAAKFSWRFTNSSALPTHFQHKFEFEKNVVAIVVRTQSVFLLHHEQVTSEATSVIVQFIECSLKIKPDIGLLFGFVRETEVSLTLNKPDEQAINPPVLGAVALRNKAKSQST